MKNIKGKVSIGLGITNLMFYWIATLWVDEYIHPYEREGQHEFIEQSSFIIAILSLVLGILAKKNEEQDVTWAEGGIVIASLEILGSLFNFLLFSKMLNFMM